MRSEAKIKLFQDDKQVMGSKRTKVQAREKWKATSFLLLFVLISFGTLGLPSPTSSPTTGSNDFRIQPVDEQATPTLQNKDYRLEKDSEDAPHLESLPDKDLKLQNYRAFVNRKYHKSFVEKGTVPNQNQSEDWLQKNLAPKLLAELQKNKARTSEQ